MKRLIPIVALFVLLTTAGFPAGYAPQPSICTRSCWGARAPQASIYYNSYLNRAVIHHTAASGDYNTTSLSTSAAKVRAVQNYHMDSNGWSDIGYNFLTDKLGNNFEGRYNSMNAYTKGSHDGWNTNSMGFNVMGYYHAPYNNTPTTPLRNSLYDVIAWRMPNGWSPYGGGPYGYSSNCGYVCGHRDPSYTACPGDLMYAYITNNLSGGEARNSISQRIAGSPPPPPPPTTIVPPPTFQANLDGRIEIYALTSGGGLDKNYQMGGGIWSGWWPFNFTGKPGAVMAMNSDGRLEAFAIGTDSALYHAWQEYANGPWSYWYSLGGQHKQFCVGTNEDGRLEVFSIGTDNAMWHKWQEPGGGWYANWVSMGGWHKQVCVGTNADGRLELFAIGSDNAVYHTWQETPNGGWYGGWANMGGYVTQIAVGSNSDGRQELFGIGSTGTVFHNWQSADETWSGWYTMGGWVKSLAVAANADGHLELFGIGADNSIVHAWQGTGGVWSSWFSLGGWHSRFAIAKNNDGRLELYGIGTDGAVYNSWQEIPNAGWYNGWLRLGGAYANF